MATKIQIKDTGLNKVGGSETYSKVNSGNWIPLLSGRINFEFNTKTTTNESSQSDINSNLTFASNEVSSIISPRFTVVCNVLASETQTIQDIIMLGRTKGIKRLTGGLGVISALPEKLVDTYDYVSVIVKNVTPSETLTKTDEWVVFTIQMEQVR